MGYKYLTSGLGMTEFYTNINLWPGNIPLNHFTPGILVGIRLDWLQVYTFILLS